MTVYQGNHDKKVLSSGLSCAHLTQTKNCGDGGAFEVPSFCGPESCKLGLSATCLRSHSVPCSTPNLGWPTLAQRILPPEQLEAWKVFPTQTDKEQRIQAISPMDC